MTGAVTPAGWYPDPVGRHERRYWDGASWTAHVADGQATAQDPLDATVAPESGDDAVADEEIHAATFDTGAGAPNGPLFETTLGASFGRRRGCASNVRRSTGTARSCPTTRSTA